MKKKEKISKVLDFYKLSEGVDKSQNNLKEAAYSAIKSAIVDQGLSPGTYLYERELTESMGISRTPIREALNRLSMEGLVQGSHNKRIQVVILKEEEIRELFETRAIMETMFIDRSIDNTPPGKLKSILQEFRELKDEIVKSKDPVEQEEKLRDYLRIDRIFHKMLVSSCGNSCWSGLYDNIFDKISICFHKASIVGNNIERTAEEHEQIIAACLADKADKVKKLMQTHIEQTRDTVLSAFKTMGHETYSID